MIGWLAVVSAVAIGAYGASVLQAVMSVERCDHECYGYAVAGIIGAAALVIAAIAGLVGFVLIMIGRPRVPAPSPWP